MNYLVSQPLHGEAGGLDSQMLGAVDAPNQKQAEKIAQRRWPGREYIIQEMGKRNKPAAKSDDYSFDPEETS